MFVLISRTRQYIYGSIFAQEGLQFAPKTLSAGFALKSMVGDSRRTHRNPPGRVLRFAPKTLSGGFALK
jgi:hypothetical protein